MRLCTGFGLAATPSADGGIRVTRRDWQWRVGLLAGWAACLIYSVVGVSMVPFHPDEATQLYMSRDFDYLFLDGQPAALAWNAPAQPVLVRRYRLLDAPLARYLAGLGRAVAGEAYIAQDWDWSATWAENEAAGAVPDSRTLAAARMPAALLTSLSVVLVYGVGERLGGRQLALSAALLYALSGLVFLHGRRAMSEGPLLFFTVLTLWLLLRPRPAPLLAGLALAAAVASKLTTLSLLPVAVAALFLASADPRTNPPRRRWLPLALLLGAFTLGLVALHPSLWSSPLAGLEAMRAARQTFLVEQSAFVQAIAPHVLLGSVGLRALAQLYHVYLAPLAYADVGNYAEATAAAERHYAALVANTGWHTPSLSFNMVLGGIVLALSLVGMAQAMRRFFVYLNQGTRLSQLRQMDEATRVRLIMMLSTGVTVAGLLAIAVPAQRYYLPLLPLACLWAAAGLASLLRHFRRPTAPVGHTAARA